MKKDLKEVLTKAKKAREESDPVSMVSWLSVATGFFPDANENDEVYEDIFAQLSKFITKEK